MNPLQLFRRVAVAEAITWALLLLGMFLKYGTRTTDVAVTVFGLLHGFVFVCYCVSTVLVWIDQRWSVRRGLIGLMSSIPPFVTLWFDRRAERQGALGTSWRLRSESPRTLPERVTAWMIHRPVRGLAADRLTSGVRRDAWFAFCP
jgi:integral membrane protein